MRRTAAAAAAAALGIALAVGLAAPAHAATTHDVTPAAPTSDYSVQAQLAALGDVLYFPASQGVGPTTLWRLDPATSTAAPVATAQDGEFDDPAVTTVDGDVVYFLGDRASVGGRSTLYVYDPATDVATAFAGGGTPALDLAVLDGIPYTVDGDGFIHVYDPSDPAAPSTTLPPALCRNGAAYTQTENITVIDGRLAFGGYCGVDAPELFLYDPASGTTTNAYVGTALPSGADLAGPNRIAEIDGVVFFAAGAFSTDQRLYRYDAAAAAITEVDPSSSNPGRPFVFDGLVTWLAEDPPGQTVIVQLVGGVPTRLPITSYGGLEAPSASCRGTVGCS